MLPLQPPGPGQDEAGIGTIPFLDLGWWNSKVFFSMAVLYMVSIYTSPYPSMLRFVHNIIIIISNIADDSWCMHTYIADVFWYLTTHTRFKSVQSQTLLPLGSPYWQLQDPRSGIRSFFRRGVVRSKPHCQPQGSRKIIRLSCYFTGESMLDFGACVKNLVENGGNMVAGSQV